MKILIVNTFYYPNMQGGAEQSVKLLAERLVRRGHQVAVYTGDSTTGENKIEEYNGVKIYRCTTGRFDLFRFTYEKNKVGKFEKILQKLMTYYNQTSEKDFVRVCDDFCPDVIHTNTLYGLPFTLWKTAYKRGIPVLHTIRDTAFVSPVQYGHKVNPLIKKLHLAYMRYYSGFVSGVTAPSEYTLNTSLEVGGCRNAKVKQCIFNSVDLDTAKLEQLIEEKSRRTSKHIKFMYSGRLIPLKGIRHMVEAFEQMKYKDCELVICGNGAMQPYVEACAEKNSRIVYCGKLNNEQLAEKYKECDVLLVPSEWPEPFGRVIIEGNKYGMPVIAARCGGIPEIIKATGGGELYQAGNVMELAEKMDYFTERSVYEKYCHAIKQSLMVFEIEKQINAFEAIYQQLILK